jgi:hypothetical protein
MTAQAATATPQRRADAEPKLLDAAERPWWTSATPL